MKKIVFIFVLVFVMIMTASAAFEYRLDLLSFKPLYKEYDAERSRASLDFQYAAVYDGYPTYIYQNGIKYDYLDFGDPLRLQPFVGIFHLGETLGLARSTFTFDHWLSPISFDVSFSGSLTNVMEGEMADTIGYDGLYFYGLNASIADKVAIRLGYSHHCTHYGDGTYKQLAEDGSVPAGFDEWFKYLRMDSCLFGLSVKPVDYVRLYAEINFNTKSTFVLPTVFSPSWVSRGAGADDVPSSYGGRIVNFGIELQYPIFKKLGQTRLSYNCRALEEGKIVYKYEELAAAGKDKAYYDESRPWEFEHTINLSQDINDLVSIDVTWHHGRFILNSYYATRSSYISVGARLNFDGTVTLYDSAK